MKGKQYSLSIWALLVPFLVVYGIALIFNPFSPKDHSSWSLAKWIGTGLVVGTGALVIEWIFEKVPLTFLRSDKLTDPIWKRGMRAMALIAIFSAILLASVLFQN